MHVCGQSNMHIVHLQQHYGIEERKTSFFQQYLQKMRKEKFSRNLVLLIFIITITGGENDDFNDNDASGQGELPA